MTFVRPLLVAAVLLVLCAAPAGAVTVKTAAARDCAGRLHAPGTSGVARTAYTPSQAGLVTVRLTAARGDWDLALFDARTRERVGAAASFGAREVATVAARRLIVQTCRRSGRAARARVRFDLHPVAAKAGPVAKIQLLRVRLVAPGDHERLEATGLDVTHNHAGGFADVVTYNAAERERLLAAGFTWEVEVSDLAAQTRRTLSRRARASQAGGLPSGRTAYRTLADYQADLKKIVDEHPGLARPVEIGRSVEDRPIEGVELAADVDGTDDGRPTFVVMGLHHAREWPSGEMPIEFGLDLAARYGTDPRATEILDNVRLLVLPVINPDGFEVSRTGPDLGSAVEAGAYKRKNCRPDEGSEDIPCALRLMQGVDLNRNYGAYWGGVGSGSSTTAANYRGPAPYSEPEAEAVHQLSQTRNIVTIITHHTYTAEGVWLRQPGFCSVEPAGCQEDADVVPDEEGMKALGDAMGEASGWQSLLGWKIGEITGATEDWNYFATGAYGYTPEQRATGFHSTYADAVVAEYTGTAAGAQGGVREALLRAAEQAGDRTWHSVIAGTAKPGSVLRLRKAFTTVTSQAAVTVADKLDLTMTVPASGTYSWDVNPSRRPLSSEPEPYEMTCETPGGQVLETRAVNVERGATATANLLCGEPEPKPTATPTPTPTAEPTPEPTAAPEPTATARPAPQPPLKPRPRMTISRRAVSAARVNRLRRFRVALRLDGGRALGVVARLVDRRGNVFADATIARLDGDARLTLARTRRLRAGRYRIVVDARDVRGRAIRAARAVRVSS